MDQKSTLIKKLRQFKRETSKTIPIQEMIFFGSRVGGKPHRWSDVDLIIVSPAFRGMRFRWRATRMYDFWTLGLPVDFLCYTPEEFRKMKKKITIVREAVETGVEIN